MASAGESRYDRRREEILRIAVAVINRAGVKGLTINAIAHELDVVPTAVAYYFTRKEDIAEACLVNATDAIRDVVGQAADTAPDQRIGAFYEGFFELQAETIRGERAPVALFNDIRAMRDNAAFSRYIALVKSLRGLLPPSAGDFAASRLRLGAAAQIMTQANWATVWLRRYDTGDFPWAARQASDIVLNGLAASATDPSIPTPPETAPQEHGEVNIDMLLRAATRLINAHGYRGALVSAIAAELRVTKGSFYHHVDRKADLLTACVNRSLDIVEEAMRRVRARGTGFHRLATLVSDLAGPQLTGAVPLLDLAALKSVPEAELPALMDRIGRLMNHLSTIVVDGIADGSIRVVDPTIAAHIVLELLNSAEILPAWTPGLSYEARFVFIAGVLGRGIRSLRV